MNEADIVEYVERVQERTQEAAAAIPPDRLNWRPRPGELTAGELVLHIASSRLMNGRRAASDLFRYDGHALAAGTTLEAVLAALADSSRECMALVRASDLSRDMVLASAPQGAKAWRILLGGLMEHEIHHRSQLCEYLSALGVAPPPLFGLHFEDLPRG